MTWRWYYFHIKQRSTSILHKKTKSAINGAIVDAYSSFARKLYNQTQQIIVYQKLQRFVDDIFSILF